MVKHGSLKPKKYLVRIKRSDEVLVAALDCFSQEIVSLRMSAEAHEKIRRHTGYPPILYNALIASFALHFRNIFDFLYSGQNHHAPKEDDVIAEDFFLTCEDWHKLLPKQDDKLIADRTRLHKQVAHITYERIGANDQQKTWDFERIINELSPGIETFYANLDHRFLKANSLLEFNHPIWSKRIKFHGLLERLKRQLLGRRR